jgi:hypothetical protein
MRVLDEVLCEVNAISGPVLHLIFFEEHLAFHSFSTILHGQLILADFGEYLGHLEYADGVIPLKSGPIHPTINIERKILSLRH